MDHRQVVLHRQQQDRLANVATVSRGGPQNQAAVGLFCEGSYHTLEFSGVAKWRINCFDAQCLRGCLDWPAVN
jgi:hypothetical protein